MKKISALLCLIILVSSFTSCSSKSSSELNAKESETITSTETTKKVEHNISLLSKQGHPKFLEELSAAEVFWSAELDTGFIQEIDVWETVYSDDVLLTYVSYEDSTSDSEYIGQIVFYFDHLEEKVPLEKALKIVGSYLPEDIIKEYYNETESYMEENAEYESINYWKYYTLKNEDADNTEKLNISLCVDVWTDMEGNATGADIGVRLYTEYTPGVTMDWNYDFFTE